MSNQQAVVWSTLPEVVPSEEHKSPGPQLVWEPGSVLPEAIEVDSKSGVHPGVLPPSYPIVTDKQSWFRRRRKAIIIGVIIAALVVVGIVVGVVVSRTQKNQPESSSDDQVSPPTTTTSTAPSQPQPQPAFGTPISFPSFSSPDQPSTCQGTVCPQILASAQFATPPTTFVFARGTDRAIWVRSISNGTWQTDDWISLGGSFLSQPTAASPRNGRIDVFGIWADDGSTRQKTYRDGEWNTEWRVVGGTCLTPPVVCSVERDNLNIVLLATNHAVVHKGTTDGSTSWEPARAVDWKDLGGWAASSPDIDCTTNSKGVRRMDVVIYGGIGETHGMFYRRWNSTEGWDAGWNSDGWRDFKGDPVVVSGGGHAAYFGVAKEDGAMWHRGWNENTGFWNGQSLGGNFESVAAAFATGSSRLDVMAVGTNGTLRHKARVDDVWGEWEDLGGFFNSAPKVVRPEGMEGRVVVFGLGPRGAIIHAVFVVGDKHQWGAQQWYSDGGVMTDKWHRAGPT